MGKGVQVAIILFIHLKSIEDLCCLRLLDGFWVERSWSQIYQTHVLLGLK